MIPKGVANCQLKTTALEKFDLSSFTKVIRIFLSEGSILTVRETGVELSSIHSPVTPNH